MCLEIWEVTRQVSARFLGGYSLTEVFGDWLSLSDVVGGPRRAENSLCAILSEDGSYQDTEESF